MDNKLGGSYGAELIQTLSQHLCGHTEEHHDNIPATVTDVLTEVQTCHPLDVCKSCCHFNRFAQYFCF